jgi:hypothetical protein
MYTYSKYFSGTADAMVASDLQFIYLHMNMHNYVSTESSYIQHVIRQLRMFFIVAYYYIYLAWYLHNANYLIIYPRSTILDSRSFCCRKSVDSIFQLT